MKKLIIACAAVLFVNSAAAQKLVIGEKAPDMKISEWIGGKPSDESKPKLIEFYYTGSSQCTGRISNIESVAQKYRGRLNVIVLAKEPAETVSGSLGNKGGTYFAAVDDGTRTFDAFGVKFVPFCVLVDGKGKVLWFGNPSSLDTEEIGRLIK